MPTKGQSYGGSTYFCTTMAKIGTDINHAKTLLEAGELVGIPTETVYGLAANALNEDAVLKIFSAKNRPKFDPLIVHTDTLAKIRPFVRHLPQAALALADRFWPGPLTLLLPKTDLITDLVTSGLDTVAVRVPAHPLTHRLLASLAFPLAAPSANPFGYISPTTAQHVEDQLGNEIKYILDGGQSSIGIESTIVGFEDETAVVYRLGGLALEHIEAVIGQVRVRAHSTSNPQAPGMLQSHYAPRKKLFIADLEKIITHYGAEQVSYLGFAEYCPDLPLANQLLLSGSGNYNEAAKNLFAHLRQLDSAPTRVIFAQLLPEANLGRAINDRIRRAGA